MNRRVQVSDTSADFPLSKNPVYLGVYVWPFGPLHSLQDVLQSRDSAESISLLSTGMEVTRFECFKLIRIVLLLRRQKARSSSHKDAGFSGSTCWQSKPVKVAYTMGKTCPDTEAHAKAPTRRSHLSPFT